MPSKPKAKPAPALTPRQARFVAEYQKDQNATQAAIRAGFEFGQAVGFYTYLLADPRDGGVFYVGKGWRSRLSRHAALVRAGRVDNAEKCRRIAEIHASGLQVLELVFAGGLSEQGALQLERVLIEELRNTGLTNIAGGNCTNAERIAELVAAAKRQLIPAWLWKLTASPEQKAMVARLYGTPEAMRQALLDELDEALALAK